jgi:hypothetical protein
MEKEFVDEMLSKYKKSLLEMPDNIEKRVMFQDGDTRIRIQHDCDQYIINHYVRSVGINHEFRINNYQELEKCLKKILP